MHDAYPVTIVDNFFDDPDEIVEMAENLKWYPPSLGNWPGLRTKQLHAEEKRFFQYFGEKIHHLFHDVMPDYWELEAHFQKIEPFSEDKWDKRNQGWIHQDINRWFGGIVYLTKDPEPDTGTSVYHVKKGYSYQTQQEMGMKEKLYKGEEIDIDEYNKAWDKMREQYVETVSVKNVYNRFVLFGGKSHHGVITFGTKERTTLNFFGSAITGHLPPLLRSR
tara:strand:+ start:203 stop:862 length:660 start_codon:yes stop_codon:yes gene_type:complete